MNYRNVPKLVNQNRPNSASQDIQSYPIRKTICEAENIGLKQIGHIQFDDCDPYPIMENQIVRLQNKKSNVTSKDDFFYFSKTKEFVKLWDSAIATLVNTKLSKGEWTIIFYLVRYVRFESCVVINGEKVITRNDIARDCFLSPDMVKNNMKQLRKLGILTEIKIEDRTKVFVNPFVFCRGTRINATLLEMFKETRWYQDLYCKASKSDIKIENDWITFDEVNFTKMWTDNFSDILTQKLTGGEFSILLLCMAHVKYSDGVLLHKNGKPLTFQNLVSMTNLSTWTVEKAIKKLLHISFLADAEYTRSSTGEIVQCYAINPILCAKGDRVKLKIHDLFNR